MKIKEKKKENTRWKEIFNINKFNLFNSKLVFLFYDLTERDLGFIINFLYFSIIENYLIKLFDINLNLLNSLLKSIKS